MIGTQKQVIEWVLDHGAGLYEIKEHKEKRSLSANAYFHVLCDKVSAVMGISAAETKNQILADYGTIDTEAGCIILRDDVNYLRFQELHLRPTGATRILDDGELYRVFYVIRGTHTYNKQEMSRAINGLVEEARALGVETIPEKELERMIARWRPKEE